MGSTIQLGPDDFATTWGLFAAYFHKTEGIKLPARPGWDDNQVQDAFFAFQGAVERFNLDYEEVFEKKWI